jgi:hypothetical protein
MNLLCKGIKMSILQTLYNASAGIADRLNEAEFELYDLPRKKGSAFQPSDLLARGAFLLSAPFHLGCDAMEIAARKTGRRFDTSNRF